MKIKLYKTNDDNNKINKTLTNEVVYNIKLKADTNIASPTIILQTDEIITSNYAYIDGFNRYYYIDDISVNANKLFTLRLVCDVLMSFKDDILNSYGNITRQTNYNDYYNFDYSSEVRKETNIYDSDIVFGDEKSMVLCTVGGV